MGAGVGAQACVPGTPIGVRSINKDQQTRSVRFGGALFAASSAIITCAVPTSEPRTPIASNRAPLGGKPHAIDERR